MHVLSQDSVTAKRFQASAKTLQASLHSPIARQATLHLDQTTNLKVVPTARYYEMLRENVPFISSSSFFSTVSSVSKQRSYNHSTQLWVLPRIMHSERRNFKRSWLETLPKQTGHGGRVVAMSERSMQGSCLSLFSSCNSAQLYWRD